MIVFIIQILLSVEQAVMRAPHRQATHVSRVLMVMVVIIVAFELFILLSLCGGRVVKLTAWNKYSIQEQLFGTIYWVRGAN